MIDALDESRVGRVSPQGVTRHEEYSYKTNICLVTASPNPTYEGHLSLFGVT